MQSGLVKSNPMVPCSSLVFFVTSLPLASILLPSSQAALFHASFPSKLCFSANFSKF